MASIFNALFGKNKKQEKSLNNKFVNAFTPQFSNDVKPENSAIFNSAVNVHAKHFSKIRPQVKFQDRDAVKFSYLNRLLQLEPNKTMNASTFYEGIARDYFLYNNAFIYIDRDYNTVGMPIKGFYLINPDRNAMQVYINEKTKDLLVTFVIESATYCASTNDIIILSRNVDPNSLFGKRDKSIETTLRVIKTNYEGIEQAIKISSYVRFLVSTTSPLKEDVRKERSKDFAKNFLEANETGLIFTDNSVNVTQIDSKAKLIDSEQMAYFKNEVLNYLGINEKIMQATYNENEWQAYYESSIEPLIIKFETELERKIFTQREYAQGNRIEILANRLQTASLATRRQIAEAYMKLPVYIPNVVAELLYLPKSESGDKEFSSLNYVQTDKQNTYQVGEEEKGVDNNGTNENEFGEEISAQRL